MRRLAARIRLIPIRHPRILMAMECAIPSIWMTMMMGGVIVTRQPVALTRPIDSLCLSIQTLTVSATVSMTMTITMAGPMQKS